MRVWRCAFQELKEEQTKKERNQSTEKKVQGRIVKEHKG